jgi:hypothetical protein
MATTFGALLEQKDYSRNVTKGIIEILSKRNIFYFITKDAKESKTYEKLTQTYNLPKEKGLIKKLANPQKVDGIEYHYVLCPDQNFIEKFEKEFVEKETAAIMA